MDWTDDHEFVELPMPGAPDEWESRAMERVLSWPKTSEDVVKSLERVQVAARCRACLSARLSPAEDSIVLMDKNGDPFDGVAPAELVYGSGGARTHVMVNFVAGHPAELSVFRDDGEPAADRFDIEAMEVIEIEWPDSA